MRIKQIKFAFSSVSSTVEAMEVGTFRLAIQFEVEFTFGYALITSPSNDIPFFTFGSCSFFLQMLEILFKSFDNLFMLIFLRQNISQTAKNKSYKFTFRALQRMEIPIMRFIIIIAYGTNSEAPNSTFGFMISTALKCVLTCVEFCFCFFLREVSFASHVIYSYSCCWYKNFSFRLF